MKCKESLESSEIDVEQKVLAAIVVDSQSFTEVKNIISIEDFDDPTNKLIFTVINDLINDNEIINLDTILLEIENRRPINFLIIKAILEIEGRIPTATSAVESSYELVEQHQKLERARKIARESELEALFLGRLLLESRAEMFDLVHVEDFVVDTHRIIYLAMKDLNERHKPIRIDTVSDELYEKGQLDKIGGYLQFRKLVLDISVTTKSLNYYANILLARESDSSMPVEKFGDADLIHRKLRVEQLILMAVFLRGEIFTKINALVEPESFNDSINRHIFKIMNDLNSKGEVVSLLEVPAFKKECGDFNFHEARMYLQQVSDLTPVVFRAAKRLAELAK